MKANWFFTLLLLGCGTGLSARENFRITGQVADAATGKGIEFATLTLCDSAATQVAAWVSDGRGKFEYTIKTPGKYALTVNSVGYAPLRREVEVAGETTDLGMLELRAGVEMDSVTVAAARSLVRIEPDKIAYNVDADPEAPVSTVLDVLRKVPMVSVDAEQSVRLKGQTNYKVLVNGKSSSLMDKNFKEVVRGMPASAVQRIEVITTPPSKYEADGVGGIINIVTRRRSLAGYSGSLGLSSDTHGSLGGNGYLSAAAGKFSISGNLYAGTQRTPNQHGTTSTENYVSAQHRYVDSEDRATTRVRYLGYQVEASYEIDTLNLVSLSLWGNNGDYTYDSRRTTTTRDASENPVQQFATLMQGDGTYGSLSGNIDYQRTFRKPGQTFTLSYKLDNSPGSTGYTSDMQGYLNYPSLQLCSEDRTWSREQTLQADYVDPLTDRHSLEAGTKAILRSNGNDPATWDRPASDQPWMLDPARRNALEYDQYILGVYGAYGFRSGKISAKAGARLECTWNDGMFHSAVGDTPFENGLRNLIPYANLSFSPRATNRYTFAYTQRLSRPGIWYLNPYVKDSDPMNLSYGNPALDAEVSHAFDLSYGSFGPALTFTLGGSASMTDNSIESLTAVDTQGVSRTTYYNIGQRGVWGLNSYVSWSAGQKFNLGGNFSGSYVKVGDGVGIANTGFTFDCGLYSSLALWKEALLNLNVYCSSANVGLQGTTSGFYYYSAGISQKLLEKKLTINLSVSNPFHGEEHGYSEMQNPTFRQRSDYWFPMRRGQLGITWNFGQTQVQVKKAQRGIRNDDLKQGGGNAGSGQGGASGAGQ